MTSFGYDSVAAPDLTGLVNTLQKSDPFGEATSSLTTLFENQQKRLEKRQTEEAQAQIRGMNDIGAFNIAERQNVINSLAYGSDIDESAVLATATQQKGILEQRAGETALTGALEQFDPLDARTVFSKTLADMGVDKLTAAKMQTDFAPVFENKQQQYDKQLEDNTKKLVAERLNAKDPLQRITTFRDIEKLRGEAEQLSGPSKINWDMAEQEFKKHLDWVDFDDEKARAGKDRSDRESMGSAIDKGFEAGLTEQQLFSKVKNSSLTEAVKAEMYQRIGSSSEIFAKLNPNQQAQYQGIAAAANLQIAQEDRVFQNRIAGLTDSYNATKVVDQTDIDRVKGTESLSGDINNDFYTQASKGFASGWDWITPDEDMLARKGLRNGIKYVQETYGPAANLPEDEIKALAVRAVNDMKTQTGTKWYDKAFTDTLENVVGRHLQAKIVQNQLKTETAEGNKRLDAFKAKTAQQQLEDLAKIQTLNKAGKGAEVEAYLQTQNESTKTNQINLETYFKEQDANIIKQKETFNTVESLDRQIAQVEKEKQDATQALLHKALPSNIITSRQNDPFVEGYDMPDKSNLRRKISPQALINSADSRLKDLIAQREKLRRK